MKTSYLTTVLDKIMLPGLCYYFTQYSFDNNFDMCQFL